jgi:hypothetical protein
LTEALLPLRRGETNVGPQTEHAPSPPLSQIKPVTFSLQEDLR